MRRTALKTSHQPHWAAPRRIEPAEGALFTRTAASAIADSAIPVDYRRAVVRLLRVGVGLNVLLWTGLAVQAVRLL